MIPHAGKDRMCILYNEMRWGLSTPESPNYILPVDKFTSVLCIYPYVYIYREPDNMAWSLLQSLGRGLSCFQSLPLTCEEFSAAPKLEYPNCQISSHPEYTSITAATFRSMWECYCTVWEHCPELQGGLGASRSTQQHLQGLIECLGSLCMASRWN
jgi:hypothetical protein